MGKDLEQVDNRAGQDVKESAGTESQTKRHGGAQGLHTLEEEDAQDEARGRGMWHQDEDGEPESP